jgi:MFS family permease
MRQRRGLTTMPGWILALTVILILQTTTAFLTRLVPVASPAFMAEFGWDETWVGYLASANIVGALFVLFTCTPLLLRIGGIRMLQFVLLLGSASIMLLYVPSLALALFACALMGFSNGAANPAGSEVLQRFTPDARRNVVFSIKQAGIPLGGVIAGLALPPLIEAFGWRAALAAAAVAIAAVTLAMWPFQARIDEPRHDRAPPFRPLSFDGLAGPLRSLKRGPGLWRIVLAGTALSVAQACLFTFIVTYVVVGLKHSLSVAGLVFAVMQAASVMGRIVVGWIADRTGSGAATLQVAAFGSASATILLGFTGAHWPLWAVMTLAAFAGVAVSGWNGVQVAEVARRSPRELVGETASGNVILVFLCHTIAPIAFAAFVGVTGRFDIGFIIAGACSLLCLPLLWGMERKA